MKDRLLASSLAAGFAALSCGVLAAVLDSRELAIAAGAFGFLASIVGAAIAARLGTLGAQVTELGAERAEMRRELDALAAIFAEEATASRREVLALARTDTTEAIMDTVSGLLDEQHFTVLVQKRVAAARRQLQPISIIKFEVDGLADATNEECDRAIASLGAVITTTLRESDAACRIGHTMAAAILEDTSEAGAVWAAERIRGSLHQNELGDTLTVSAGIACYPTHALTAPELMERAARALDTARAQGRDRLEVASGD